MGVLCWSGGSTGARTAASGRERRQPRSSHTSVGSERSPDTPQGLLTTAVTPAASRAQVGAFYGKAIVRVCRSPQAAPLCACARPFPHPYTRPQLEREELFQYPDTPMSPVMPLELREFVQSPAANPGAGPVPPKAALKRR